MANQDPIPGPDNEFDTLQGILVTAATTNKVAWGIPDAEITKLTDKQAIWVPAWLIAKDKLNSTTAQKKAKDLARKNYEKVLRPFIQKWIYRNELMDEEDVENCGLKPRDTTPSVKPAPATPGNIKIDRSQDEVLKPSCGKAEGAENYGCILSAEPLPDNVGINEHGQLVIKSAPDGPEGPGAPSLPVGSVLMVLDFSKKRKKIFTELVSGQRYYVHFYSVNSSGASALSAPVNVKCM
jgi:hypothetical protein